MIYKTQCHMHHYKQVCNKVPSQTCYNVRKCHRTPKTQCVNVKNHKCSKKPQTTPKKENRYVGREVFPLY